MMRSLLITDSRIWTAEAEYASAVAAAEASMGWDVTVAAPPGSPVSASSPTCAATAELPGRDPGRSPADFVACVRFLSALVGEGSFGVVHSSRSAPHIMAALAAGSRVPVVHLRGGAAIPRRHAANRFLYRARTASVVVSSRRVERWVVERLGVPAGRVHRVLAPVQLTGRAREAPRASVREEFGIETAAPLIVNVARLAPIKGQYVLIEAMASVLRDVPDARIVLVGEPWSGEPEGLEARARELGIDRSLITTGRRDDVDRFVAEATVCVASSLGSEENSRAVSEYMTSGKAVVASRVGVIPELIEDGTSGLLVAPGDATELADAVGRLLSDSALRDLLGANARAFAASKLSPEAFAEGIGAAIESAGVRL